MATRYSRAKSARVGKKKDAAGKTSNGLDKKWIRKRLGASYSFPITAAGDGAFGAAALALEVEGRLRSRGGRPSDPGARMRRLVPMKKSVWLDLQREAKAASTPRRRLSPGQLAAILVERSLMTLKSER